MKSHSYLQLPTWRYLMVAFLNRPYKIILSLAAGLALASGASAASIFDAGASVPTPGGSDVSQLTDDATGVGGYVDSNNPGQTFTTGANAAGYALKGLYLKERSTSAGGGMPQPTSYTVRIYSVSGTTATLLSTYVTDNQANFAEGDWFQITGLTNILSPNTVYGYAININGSGKGWWEPVGNSTQPYAGGTAGRFPTGTGTITVSAVDSAFDVNLDPIVDPYVFPTSISPPSGIVGNSVVISAGVPSGTQPIYFQWQFTGTNGITAKIPNATNISYTIASVQFTNMGTYSLIYSNNPGGVPTRLTNAPATLAVRNAYIISDFGTTAPVPGANDISQLLTNGIVPGGTAADGLGYYDNNNAPGQTFTTGSNPAGYTLNALYVRTAGLDSSGKGTAQNYTLRIYSVSGSTATLLSTYITDNTLAFTDGTWLRYGGMTNILQPNTVYAYTHVGTSNWDLLGWASNSPSYYSGGELVSIPNVVNVGGTSAIATGPSHNLDGTFLVNMVPNGFPAVQVVSISPANTAGNPVYAGTPVTLSATAVGAPPLVYKWQTDGGLGGAFSDIPSSNTNSFVINTTGMTPGTYLYQVIVTNVNSSATSSVVTLNLVAASGPVLVTDTSVNPAFVTVGTPVQASAAFTGTLPITYQWRFTDTNNVTINISGATNNTYSIALAQLTDNGNYSLVASNAVGGAVTVSSTPAQLTVVTLAQANTTSAGIFDASSTPPSPGTYDIAQLVTAVPTANPLGGLNYYVDNFTPPGQTFTTGNTPPTPAGYQLSSLYLQEELSTAGGPVGGPLGTDAQSYTLGIYSVSGNNAVLLTSYVSTNTLAITENDWIQWTGLTNVLRINSTYAFSIQRNLGGWWKVGNDQNSSAPIDNYAGGQAVSLPNSGYGAMVFSSDTTIDAGFLIGLIAVPANGVNTMPTNITRVVSGNNLTLSWPLDHTGWRLQSQTNAINIGLGTNWVDVAGASATNQVTIPMNPANGSVFYRMIYP